MQIAPEPLGLAVPGVPGFQLTALPAISGKERRLVANLSEHVHLSCSSFSVIHRHFKNSSIFLL